MKQWELDELEEIALLTAFGTNGVTGRSVPGRKRVITETCANGHPWSEETIRWRRSRGRFYRACRICEKLKRVKK